jgi:hypothetical protein
MTEAVTALQGVRRDYYRTKIQKKHKTFLLKRVNSFVSSRRYWERSNRDSMVINRSVGTERNHEGNKYRKMATRVAELFIKYKTDNRIIK